MSAAYSLSIPQQTTVRASTRSDHDLAEVLRGLSQSPPTLSPRWFYDALGSALFDAITRLSEYYPTRCELEILDQHGAALGAMLPDGLAVVELGSGNADKIGRLLPHLHKPRAYHPIDVSDAALASTERALRGRFVDLPIEGWHADFTNARQTRPLLERVRREGPILLFFPGSTLGNFDAEHARSFLAELSAAVPTGTPLLLGVDLIKDAAVLEAAYDDPVGVTAAFNRNALAHLNTRFGADFEPGRWRHAARWVPEHRRMEMWLHSIGRQTVTVGGEQIVFEHGDGIHTESSHKWDRPSLNALARSAGWTERAWLSDQHDWFAEVVLVKRTPSSSS